MIPIILQTKSFTIYTLWFFFGIAVIAGVYTLIKLSVRNGMKIKFLSDNFWKLIFWALIGARIISIIENYNSFFYELSARTFLRFFEIWDKGLSLWGAVLGFSICFYILAKREEQDIWKWLDTIVPAFLVSYSVMSLGAFFDGINYGNVTSLPWGVNFDNPSVRYTVPIHPTQIYALLYSGAIAASAILINENRKFKEKTSAGFLGLCTVAVFALFRFLEEFVRGDDTWLIMGIRLPQIIALLMAILSGTFIFLRYNRPTHKSKKQ